jgi:hypothetical protein
MNGAQPKKTSPWLYVLGGCGCLVVLAVVGVAGFLWWAGNQVKEFGESMEDPVQRMERAREVVGAAELPPGYHAGFGMEMPFGVLAIAMIGDGDIPPGANSRGVSIDEDDLFDRRGFIYFRMRNFNQEQESENPAEELMRDYREDEELGRGTIEAAGGTVEYVLSRGTIRRDNAPEESYLANLTIDCGSSDAFRNAVWFTAVPGSAQQDGGEDDVDVLESDLPEAEGQVGEPLEATAESEMVVAEEEMAEEPLADWADEDLLLADSEESLVEFLSYFDLCQ